MTLHKFAAQGSYTLKDAKQVTVNGVQRCHVRFKAAGKTRVLFGGEAIELGELLIRTAQTLMAAARCESVGKT